MNKEERVRLFTDELEIFSSYKTERGVRCLNYDETANALDILGYRKVVWHKVADGDLPKRQGQRVWIYTDSEDYFEVNYYDDTSIGGEKFFEIEMVGRIKAENVISWTELPTYNE